jgi:hypothetical protein
MVLVSAWTRVGRYRTRAGKVTTRTKSKRKGRIEKGIEASQGGVL